MNPDASTPLVTVIIPTHNRARTILAAVETALKQTYPNKEIIVVDDGSVDDTASILSGVAGIRYVAKPQGGPSSARNRGFREAKGSIIAPLDSDDLWDDDYLARAVDVLEATGAGVVCTSFRGVQADGTVTYSNYYTELRPHLAEYLGGAQSGSVVLDSAQARSLFLAHSEAPSSAMVLRREVMSAGWDDRLFCAEDQQLVLQAILDHHSRVTLILDPAWTKQTGTGNIYDGSSALARNARMNILANRIIRERWGIRLTPAERAVLNHRDAVEYADWGYAELRSGKWLRGAWYYLRSLLADSTVVSTRRKRRKPAAR